MKEAVDKMKADLYFAFKLFAAGVFFLHPATVFMIFSYLRDENRGRLRDGGLITASICTGIMGISVIFISLQAKYLYRRFKVRLLLDEGSCKGVLELDEGSCFDPEPGAFQ